MAKRCDICGKGPQVGNTVSHANNRAKTRNMPNLKQVRAVIPGHKKLISICTRCIRSNRFQKAA